jgi:integrase
VDEPSGEPGGKLFERVNRGFAPHMLDRSCDCLAMAALELINYVPYRPRVSVEGNVTWEPDTACRSIKSLPQIFWAEGSPWLEANFWAHERATSGKTNLKTVQSNLRHLHKYAQWLEAQDLDWRHFPMLERDRSLVRWRKELIVQRDKYGLLAPSTATQRMNATIHFYRFARAFGLIGPEAPMWEERKFVRRFHDVHGFERTMQLSSTDLSIPCRTRHGILLEDGLSPLTTEQRDALLAFTSMEGNASRELDLMLKLGFYSGARIQTIADLKRGSLDNAVSYPAAPGLVYLMVGPGHKPFVSTKFGVSGRIIVPTWLLGELHDYVGCPSRLKREVRAPRENKDLLFLTRYGNRYANRESNSGTAIDKAMVDLRRRATEAGLIFAKHLRFHATRATFGTWLTATLLKDGHDIKAVLAFVCEAMLHKDVKTTLSYIKFVEQTPIRIKVANEYSQAFLGINTRFGGSDAP